MLRLKKCGADRDLIADATKQYIFKNKPGRTNIAIVMYHSIRDFEKLCGHLYCCKVIHLLRDPTYVARSWVQAISNKERYGENYRAHYQLDEEPPPHAPIKIESFIATQRSIKNLQKRYIKLFAAHSNIMTIKYDDVTKNQQVNELPELYARAILAFLGLEVKPLRNQLRKTGVSASGCVEQKISDCERMEFSG